MLACGPTYVRVEGATEELGDLASVSHATPFCRFRPASLGAEARILPVMHRTPMVRVDPVMPSHQRISRRAKENRSKFGLVRDSNRQRGVSGVVVAELKTAGNCQTP